MPTLTLPTRESFECDRFPDECPVCHKHVHPTMKLAQKVERSNNGSGQLQAVFLCPNLDCGSFFIAYFDEPFYRPGYSRDYQLRGSSPYTPKKPVIYDGITKLSPNFYEIYAQATEADQRKLDQVAGVGYRKALEFLIKDYCCLKRPQDAETIKKTMLGPCIDRYVSDENIKDCAKLATWLGNDETHYVRKWTNNDITDLKSLIHLTLSWIETSIRTDQYRATMLNKAS